MRGHPASGAAGKIAKFVAAHDEEPLPTPYATMSLLSFGALPAALTWINVSGLVQPNVHMVPLGRFPEP